MVDGSISKHNYSAYQTRMNSAFDLNVYICSMLLFSHKYRLPCIQQFCLGQRTRFGERMNESMSIIWRMDRAHSTMFDTFESNAKHAFITSLRTISFETFSWILLFSCCRNAYINERSDFFRCAKFRALYTLCFPIHCICRL